MEEPWLKEWWPNIEACQRTLAFDIGANVGTWTTDLAPLFYKVVSVEPDMRCNPPHGREYDRRAIWSKTGHATLHRREHSVQSSLLPTHAVGDGGNEVHVVATETVQCITLDDLSLEYGPPDFIKMDIEGGEVEALAGATLACFSRCTWLIELHDTRNEVLPHIQRLGFKGVKIIVHPYKNAAPGHEWLLAKPK